MTTPCDACGSKGGNSWMMYHGMFSRDKNSLQKFIVKRSGKEKNADDFELCGNCNEEWKIIFSQELKEEIIQKLTTINLVDCWADFIEYFNQKYLLGNDWGEVKKTLVENIKRYKNEWEIKEMDWNKDGEYYWDDGERRERVNKQIILTHQTAQIEYSSNGFLIIKLPKMFRRDYFSPEQWTEIQKVLSQKQTATENQSPTKIILIICGITILTIVMIILLAYLARKKRVRNKIK